MNKIRNISQKNNDSNIIHLYKHFVHLFNEIIYSLFYHIKY